MEETRNSALENGVTKIINGKEYHSKYKEYKPGFVQISTKSYKPRNNSSTRQF